MMATDPRRVQFSVRVSEHDKNVFSEQVERCGMDPSVAVRTLVELAVQRLERGGDFIDALHELKQAWSVPRSANPSQPTPPVAPVPRIRTL
jgi:hypothetical protein